MLRLFSIGLLISAFAGAEELSDLAERLALHYRDTSVQALDTADLQREIRTALTSGPADRRPSRVAQIVLAARIRQMEGVLTAEDRAAIRSKFFQTQRQSTGRINGAYFPQSRDLGNEAVVVELPRELEGSWIHQAIKLHEVEHFIQNLLARRWGREAEFRNAVDRLITNTDPTAAFLTEYGALGLEGIFVNAIPDGDRRELRRILDGLRDLDPESRAFALRLLGFKGTADDYRKLQWRHGRYGWEKFTRLLEPPAALLSHLPVVRYARERGLWGRFCDTLFAPLRGLVRR